MKLQKVFSLLIASLFLFQSLFSLAYGTVLLDESQLAAKLTLPDEETPAGIKIAAEPLKQALLKIPKDSFAGTPDISPLMEILKENGGRPKEALFVLNGAPGSAKTKLANNLCAEIDRVTGERPLYLPAGKITRLLAYMFNFFYTSADEKTPANIVSLLNQFTLQPNPETFELEIIFQGKSWEKDARLSPDLLQDSLIVATAERYEFHKYIDLYLAKNVFKLMREHKRSLVLKETVTNIAPSEIPQEYRNYQDHVFQFWLEEKPSFRKQHRRHAIAEYTDSQETIQDAVTTAQNSKVKYPVHHIRLNVSGSNNKHLDVLLNELIHSAIQKTKTVSGSYGFFYLRDKELRKKLEDPKLEIINLVIAGGGGDAKTALILARELQIIFENQKQMGRRNNEVLIQVLDSSLKRASESPNGGPHSLDNLGKIREGAFVPLKKKPLDIVEVPKNLVARVHLTDENLSPILWNQAPIEQIIPISVGSVVSSVRNMKGIKLYMFDSNLSGKELAKRLRAFSKLSLSVKSNRSGITDTDVTNQTLTVGVDVGLDILTTGKEKGVRSPATDATVLDAMSELGSYIFGAGIGADGELGKALFDLMLEYHGKKQIFGVMNQIGFFSQIGEKLTALLQNLEGIKTESSNIPIEIILQAISELQNYMEEPVGPYARKLFTSLLQVRKIRGGTRKALLPLAVTSIIVFKAKDIEDKISFPDLDIHTDDWNKKAAAFEKHGHITERTDINNIRDRIATRLELLTKVFTVIVEKEGVSSLQVYLEPQNFSWLSLLAGAETLRCKGVPADQNYLLKVLEEKVTEIAEHPDHFFVNKKTETPFIFAHALTVLAEGGQPLPAAFGTNEFKTKLDKLLKKLTHPHYDGLDLNLFHQEIEKVLAIFKKIASETTSLAFLTAA